MDSEMFSFVGLCNALMRVFPKRIEEYEKAQLHRDYFKALRHVPYTQIEAGAEAWIQRGKYFPKPAEWLHAIPTPAKTCTEAMPLSDVEARDYRHAVDVKYEDVPCHCPECASAHVTDKPIRFVPEFSADGTDRRVVLDGRIVTAGHWAHGAELARWWQARAAFWSLVRERKLTSTVKELTREWKSREPGEDD